ncbi:hypothetical protein DUNSADRAFT_7253 [Dunaliella salina]|uniref:Methyltransferase type 11 domain-containing protein n=1 Tax=Dunaliella salina TaxID=3046 RepID=A0ABQ7FTG0_DUNSA|nr:hypothetical protein DUNSADRAFT_7253 [Dunaliella salina]|eukprot:KAF5825739.1 hypothetical protein DUNSADRAFT_7253 [Dunaliella salina]
MSLPALAWKFAFASLILSCHANGEASCGEKLLAHCKELATHLRVSTDCGPYTSAIRVLEEKDDTDALEATLTLVSKKLVQKTTTFQTLHLARSHVGMRTCMTLSDITEVHACLTARKIDWQDHQQRDPFLVPTIHKLMPGIQSVLDFGSASGGYLSEHFNAFNVSLTVGLEPDMYFGPLTYYTLGWDTSKGPIQLHPASTVNDEHAELRLASCYLFGAPSNQYDLVTTFEVFEHIPIHLHCALLNALTSQARRWVVVSIARIGQSGINHVANRPREEFKFEFIQRGFIYRPDLSSEILASVRFRSLKKNLMVLQVGPYGTVNLNCSSVQSRSVHYEDRTKHSQVTA